MAGYTLEYSSASPNVASALQFGTDLYNLPSSIADGAILSRSGTAMAATAGSVQGSVLAWHAASSAFLDTSRAWDISTTTTAGLVLANTTAATAGTVAQWSPAIELSGTAWNTTTSASVVSAWRIENRPVTGATTTSTLQFLYSVGGGAFGSAGYIASNSTWGGMNYVAANIYLRAATTLTLWGAATTPNLGLGTTALVQNAADTVLAQGATNRTDGANNIVFADCYDRNAASITNAATMRLRSFGWTNNSDVYTEFAAVYCDGMVEGTGIRAKGDIAGAASTTSLTNVSAAPDSTAATISATPTGIAGASSGWIKIYVGTTAAYIPYWVAA